MCIIIQTHIHIFTRPRRSVVGRLRGTRAHIDALNTQMHAPECTSNRTAALGNANNMNATNPTHVHIQMCARLRKTIASGCGITPRAPTIPEAALVAKRVSRPRNCEGQAEFLASLTKTRRNLYSSECV